MHMPQPVSVMRVIRPRKFREAAMCMYRSLVKVGCSHAYYSTVVPISIRTYTHTSSVYRFQRYFSATKDQCLCAVNHFSFNGIPAGKLAAPVSDWSYLSGHRAGIKSRS